MTDDRAERALRDALAEHAHAVEFFPLDPDALRSDPSPVRSGPASRTASDPSPAVRPVRRRSRPALALAAAVVAMLILPVGMLFVRGSGEYAGAPPPVGVQRSEPADGDAAGAEERADGQTQVEAEVLPDATSADAAPCPTPGPPSGGIADLPVVLVWDGRTYAPASDERVELGEVVGEVSCPIGDIAEGGTRPVPEPWPDGSATFLPAGTPIHEVVGADARCTLGVRFDGRDVALHADDPDC